MLSPHIRLAFRQLKKNKVFTLLNILGLTLTFGRNKKTLCGHPSL